MFVQPVTNIVFLFKNFYFCEKDLMKIIKNIKSLLIASFLCSCSSKQYLKYIPYQYSFQEVIKQKKSELSKLKNEVIVDDNEDNLKDEDLKLKEKYSIILGVMPKEIKNYELYSYVDKWVGTPYKKGILDLKEGADCSFFAQTLYSEVYDEVLPKDPAGMFRSKLIQLFTGRTYLQEGDLIFLRYDKDHPISDVGIYLKNDRIIACTAEGLDIYNFNDKYFQLRFVSAGRLVKSKK